MSDRLLRDLAPDRGDELRLLGDHTADVHRRQGRALQGLVELLSESPTIDVGVVLSAAEERGRLLRDLDALRDEEAAVHRALAHRAVEHAWTFSVRRALDVKGG